MAQCRYTFHITVRIVADDFFLLYKYMYVCVRVKCRFPSPTMIRKRKEDSLYLI